MWLKARAISRATPIVTCRGAPCCACDAQPHILNIGMFKSGKKYSTAIKHIYNESANKIEGCNVIFDTKDCWNFP